MPEAARATRKAGATSGQDQSVPCAGVGRGTFQEVSKMIPVGMCEGQQWETGKLARRDPQAKTFIWGRNPLAISPWHVAKANKMMFE